MNAPSPGLLRPIIGPAKPNPASVIAPDIISVVPPPCILADAAPIAPNAIDLVAQPFNLPTLPNAAPSTAPIAVLLNTFAQGCSYEPKNPTVPNASADPPTTAPGIPTAASPPMAAAV